MREARGETLVGLSEAGRETLVWLRKTLVWLRKTLVWLREGVVGWLIA